MTEYEIDRENARRSMKTLEDIFSSKEQKELLEKYEDALFRQFQAEMEIKSIKQSLLDTLPIKRGVWFKYGEHGGVIINTMLDNDLETVYIRYNAKGGEEGYREYDDWIEINLIADLDKIQIIPQQ